MRIMIVRSYDKILDEYKIKLAAEKKEKKFLGSLFFELDEKSEEIKEIFKVIELEDGADTIQIANAAYKLSYEYGLLAKDGQSWATYEHWAWVNGVADANGDWEQTKKMSKLEKELANFEKLFYEPGKVDFEKYEELKLQIKEFVKM